MQQIWNTHQPQQYTKLFVDVQKVINLLLFMKVYRTVQNVNY